MYSSTEFQGQSSLDKHGTIEVNTEFSTSKKPAWLVLVKLVIVMGMVVIGAAIVTPALMKWLPPWKAALISIGIVQIYIGIAFFFRPKYNPDNMGWAGGLANDPFQYSDNINRSLFSLHMLLGPGRFAADTILDICALIGLAKGADVEEERPAVTQLFDPAAYSRAAGQAGTPPVATPRADRFDVSRAAAATAAQRNDPA